MQRVISGYYFIFFFAMAATWPFLSLYLRQQGLNGTHIGLLLAVGSVAGALAQPILGAFNDRTPDVRRLLLYSAVVSPIFFAGYAVFRPYWVLLVVAILVAIAQSTMPIMDAVAIKEGEKRGFAYGQVRLWGAFSFAIGAGIFGYVYHVVGLSSQFLFYALLSVLIVWSTTQLPVASDRLATAHEPLLRGIWSIARRKNLIVLMVICFLLATAITANGSFLPLYYQNLHYPMGWVGINFTVAALIEVPFFYVSGKIVARLGAIWVLLIGSLAYTIKYAIMATAPGVFVVIGAQLLDGIGYALYWSASVQLVSALAPRHLQATAQTVYGAVAGSLSSIVGTALGGYVFDHAGPLMLYKSIAGLSAVSMVCIVLFARFGLPRRPLNTFTLVSPTDDPQA